MNYTACAIIKMYANSTPNAPIVYEIFTTMTLSYLYTSILYFASVSITHVFSLLGMISIYSKLPTINYRLVTEPLV